MLQDLAICILCPLSPPLSSMGGRVFGQYFFQVLCLPKTRAPPGIDSRGSLPGPVGWAPPSGAERLAFTSGEGAPKAFLGVRGGAWAALHSLHPYGYLGVSGLGDTFLTAYMIWRIFRLPTQSLHLLGLFKQYQAKSVFLPWLQRWGTKSVLGVVEYLLLASWKWLSSVAHIRSLSASHLIP